LVLTAAHCKFAAPEMMKVAINPYFGPGTRAATGSETFNVVEIRIHPKFGDRAPFANDVMILKLDGTSKFRPITLNRNRTFPVNATRLTVLGWGTQERGQDKPPPYLLQDSAISVTNSYCQQKYKTLPVTGEMLCVRDDGSCQGDSGGPLIMKGINSRQDVQVGVVSWGIGCNSDIYPGE
jgi:trypsin